MKFIPGDGSVFNLLLAHHATVTGMDVSREMITIARENQPDVTFHIAYICSWESDERFPISLPNVPRLI